jgi:H+/Cl- antiporter ClcA
VVSGGRVVEDRPEMSRARRAIAPALAAAALAMATCAIVANLVAQHRGAHHSLNAWAAPPFLVAVMAPACVGLFVAWRRPGNRGRGSCSAVRWRWRR